MLPLRLESGTALWVDAAGTLLHPARPVPEVYAAFARQHGHDVDVADVKARLGPAMKKHEPLRTGDPTWSRYWQAVVAEAIAADDQRCFEALYEHYAGADAWRVAADARPCLASLRERGVRLALISNWDDRLRSTLEHLALTDAFDALLISGEEGVEKPDPEIFRRAAERLRVPAGRSLMIGDDLESDVAGARAAGAFVIQFGNDIKGFADIMDS